MPDDKPAHWKDGTMESMEVLLQRWNDRDDGLSVKDMYGLIEGLLARVKEPEKIDKVRKQALEVAENWLDNPNQGSSFYTGLQSGPTNGQVRQQIWEAINCPEDMEMEDR